MFESYIMNQPDPDVLEVKKTKLTRAIWVIIVFVLILWILSPIYQVFTWPELKSLIYATWQIMDQLKLDRLNQFPLAGKLVLGMFAVILAFSSLLIWMIINMLKEKVFLFDSKKREITKNGRSIAKFDDIKNLKITTNRSPLFFSFNNLSLYFKMKKGIFSRKINLGIIFKWKEATEIGFKIAETFGVEVTHKGLLSE